MMLSLLPARFLRGVLSIALAVAALAPPGVQAADAAPPAATAPESGPTDSNWDRTKKLLSTVWNEGKQELYVPGYTWHNPSTYTQQQRDGYTTYAAGIGYGRTWTSDSNNDHSLYAMGFQDSHNDFQPIVGYVYQWMWGQQRGLRAGVGVTAFITARADTTDGWCKYCPFPGVLPVASISYWRVSLMGTYVPRVGSNGDVAFFWAKIALD